MMSRVGLAVVAVFLATSTATVFFKDQFHDGNVDKWVESTIESETLGKLEFAKPKDIFDEKEDGGLKTTTDARFYRYSAPLEKTLVNKDKEMCVQFLVKHEQQIDCGGGYVKLMGESFEPKELTGDTDYEIMFGPDICGYSTQKVHVIFSHKGKNHLVKEDIPCKTDALSHLYTLIVRPNNSYEVLVDRERTRIGSLIDDFDMVPPKMIPDPEAKKPEDWVDEAEIADPEDKKPEDWDQPKTIVDEKATKPDDWDEDADGEWEAPQIDNPDYKGEWHPKMIPNPAYKGEWEAPQIENPDFKDEPELYSRKIAHVALDLWQVKSGTIFDDFIISDDLDECAAMAEHWESIHKKEKEADEKKREEEMKKFEEESKKQKESKGTDSEDEDALPEEDQEEDDDTAEEEPKQKHEEL